MTTGRQPMKRKTFPLRLTKFELVHLRDLFSVLLPLELKQTVSQALAAVEERTFVETRLWQKVVSVLVEADIPRDSDAPDFICAASAAPPVGVFKLSQEPNEGEQQEEGDEGAVFGGDEEEEEEGDGFEPGLCGNCGKVHKTEKQAKRCFGATGEKE